MAEGGLPPEQDLHLLECPICLERFQQPKSLPCLHSFCQDCLGTYITKEVSGKIASKTSFPCPVCRRRTYPINQAETKKKWVEQFPTNNMIQDLIQLRERSSEPLYCKPCQTEGNLFNPAQFWCKSMNENFCEACKVKLHDIIHTDCGIVDITINDNTRLKPKISALRCDRHDKKIVWHCEDHQILGCNVCVFKDHRRCEKILTVTNYLLELKKEAKLEEMRAALKRGAEVMNSLVKDFDEQLQTMVQSQEIALQSIADLREKIDKRLNKLQEGITDGLIMLFKDEKRNQEASLRQCERLMNGMLNTLKLSIKAAEENDNIETIVLYQRAQAEVDSCKTLVAEMGKSFTSASIEHHIVPGHDIISDYAMGKIVVRKEPRCIPCHHCDFAPPMSERRVKEIGRFNIESPSDENACHVLGVVYLPGSQIVVSDCFNKKLKLFTDKGQYLDELTVPIRPGDMCLVNNTTVAVADKSSSRVNVVNVEASKLSLVSEINITNGKYYDSITHMDGSFVVSSLGEVYSVTQGGSSEFLYNYNNYCWSLAHDPIKGDILVSVDNDKTGDVAVSRLSAGKRHTDVMKVGVVRRALGIDVDREGNIYVCGEKSDNVVQISGDGKHVRELLTLSDGIKSPWAIAVRGDSFVVIDKTSTSARNNIRVFQLY
ncbi:uncharacterized protein LOC110462595 [Mizuhopecten yessoensis]|uniref:uncharacterized protein LOC110462595 n=1 Tax=Mizuhopecten yessoensis TaxID=6573 RepID=UPI000B45CF82|nr:uncharacterized protein LOC110462595 [Mizuhopecten yessoensis]